MDTSSITGFFSHIPTDWIVIFAFVALLTIDSVRSGTGRACAIILALPVSLYLISELPRAVILSGLVNEISTPIIRTLIVGVLFAIAYFLVRRATEAYGSGSGSIIQGLIAGVAATSVLLVVWLQIPELQTIWNFGPLVQAVFGEAYRFWWILGSYAALAFVRS